MAFKFSFSTVEMETLTAKNWIAEMERQPKPKNYETMTTEELLEELKKSKDFDKLVFPNSFYSKFELPNKECMNMKEFIKESPWMKRSQYVYTGCVEEIKPKPGGNRPVLPAPEVPAIVALENNFSDAPTNQIVDANQQETHGS